MDQPTARNLEKVVDHANRCAAQAERDRNHNESKERVARRVTEARQYANKANEMAQTIATPYAMQLAQFANDRATYAANL